MIPTAAQMRGEMVFVSARDTDYIIRLRLKEELAKIRTNSSDTRTEVDLWHTPSEELIKELEEKGYVVSQDHEKWTVSWG